jgi:hypothetical protein
LVYGAALLRSQHADEAGGTFLVIGGIGQAEGERSARGTQPAQQKRQGCMIDARRLAGWKA